MKVQVQYQDVWLWLSGPPDKRCMAQVYSSSRAFVPSALHSSVRVVENKVSELGSPLISAVQNRSEQVLTSLDRKVSPLLACWQNGVHV